MKNASGRRIDGRRHVPLKDDPLGEIAARSAFRNRGEESRGVRMLRILVQLGRRADLDDMAEVHDRDAVGDVPDDAQIVRDEDVGEVEIGLQALEEVENLGLDRDVERRDRLVADDQLRAEGERARDPDPLPLTAGELVRIAVVMLRIQPDAVHELLHAPFARALRLVDREGRSDDRADRLPRVQRGIRILKDHLHLPAERPHLAPIQLGDVPAVELDRPGGRLDQLRDQTGSRRLAATGFAHETHRLAWIDAQRDVFDRVDGADLALEDDPARDREPLREALDGNERLIARSPRGRRALLGRDAHQTATFTRVDSRSFQSRFLSSIVR